MRLYRVGADAENNRALLLELSELVAKRAGFLRATRRVVARIKIEDDIFAEIVGERDFPAVARGDGEFGGDIADL